MLVRAVRQASMGGVYDYDYDYEVTEPGLSLMSSCILTLILAPGVARNPPRHPAKAETRIFCPIESEDTSQAIEFWIAP